MSDAESGMYSYSRRFMIPDPYPDAASSRIDDSQTQVEDRGISGNGDRGYESALDPTTAIRLASPSRVPALPTAT